MIQAAKKVWIRFLPLPVLLFLAAYITGGGSLGEATLSLSFLVVLCFTAYPLSRRTFQSVSEAIIFTFPIGLVLHTLGLALLGFLFGMHLSVLLIYLGGAITAFVMWEVIQTRRSSAATVSQWTSTDTWTLYSWLFCILAVLALPYAHIGKETADGVSYRAYFNADFFRNMGVAGSILNTGIPPQNPYFAGEPLHYHWFFQVLPAYWRLLFLYFRQDLILSQFSLFTALMFGASLFATVRRYTTTQAARWIAIIVLLFGASYDGLYALVHLGNIGGHWTSFRDFNIDGISRWLWGAPQIDTLLRTMMYGPQHLVGLMILLMVLTGWKADAPRVARYTLMNLLFVAVAFSTFLAGVGIAFLAVVLGRTLIRKPREFGDVLVFACCGLLFLGLFLKMQMFAPGSAKLSIGMDWALLRKLPVYWLLEMGALGVLGIAGMFYNSGNVPVRPLAAVILSSLMIILFARLDLTDQSVFSIKFGYIIHLALFLLMVGFLDRWILSRRGGLFALLILAIAPAALTTAMDVYNAQDINNAKFTTTIDSSHSQMLNWLRRNVPATSVIQNDITRDEGYVDKYVTEIPPFAGRAVYLSDPILSQLFQIPPQHLQERARVVCGMFAADSPEKIHANALRAEVSYLLLEDIHDSLVVTHLIEPFFTLMASHGEMAVWRVNKTREPDINPSAQDDQADDSIVLLRTDEGRPILKARMGQNFYGSEPQDLCGTANWMSDEAVLMLNSETDIHGELSFHAFSLGKDRTLVVTLKDREVFRGKVPRAGITLHIPVQLEAGKNRLRLKSLEGADPANQYEAGSDTRPLSFKIFRLIFTS